MRALVMEIVEGPTLADRIDRLRAKGSGLPLDEALPIARQIAEALEAAHDLGVVLTCAGWRRRMRGAKPTSVALSSCTSRRSRKENFIFALRALPEMAPLVKDPRVLRIIDQYDPRR